MAEGGEHRIPGVDDVPPPLLPEGNRYASLAEGENINQRIINSSVNVVAGDQIHGDKTTIYYIMNSGIDAIPSDQHIVTESEQGSSSSPVYGRPITVEGDIIADTINYGEIYREEKDCPTFISGNTGNQKRRTGREKASTLIKCINDNASQKTADKILEDIGADDLSKPDFQVHPQMRRVTKSEYFKGNYEEVHGMEVEVKRKFFFWQKIEVVKNQFRKEFGFLRQKVDDNKFIDLDEVLQQVINGDSSITAIVASAGSGKTTLMRRIAKKTLGHSLTNTEAIASPSQLKYKLIHYIEIKGMRDKGLIKPSKFLFGGLFQNEIDEDNAYQWLLEHQSDSVLFFDGLDQATWKINRDGDENINPYTLAEAATIMYNILSRDILADTKIVISSREFQVSDLPAEARPADIITLSGLTLDDAKRLFLYLIRQRGDKAWEKMEKMSPRLVNLVSIPVFLVLTAVIMAKNPKEPPPKTVTGLYKKIISTLSSVKNIRNAKAIAGVVNKLKAMAYRGMEEGRVTFSENDLKIFGLSTEEVQDLMMKVPGNNLLSCNLLDGSFIFFFCHQSLQEFLAAGFVAEMSLPTFMFFNYGDLHKERWTVVRRFVCGIIYDETQDNLHEVSNRSLKKRFLAGSIRSHLKEANERVGMELYTAIYESGDGDLMKQISDIDASHFSLSRDEAHIVGSLAARSESLKSLRLFRCNINNELLSIITGCLEKRIHVKEVDLSDNMLSATALRSLLGHRRIESLSGKLDWEVVKLTVVRWDVELKNEEDVIKISGYVIEGHFDSKDSSLSFKKVRSLAALKYVSDLFDAKFVKLIEELFVQEDGLRELSEYRIEKVKEVDLRYNNFSATALRSFLGHRRIESLSGKLDWEVVKLSVDGRWVELKNEEDVINISGNGIKGHFDSKDSSLSFKNVRTLAALKYVSDLFDAKYVKLIEELFVQEDGLRELSQYRIEKISKILLDCTEEEEIIDWSLIETCWKKYQSEFLDIAVNGLIPVQDYSRLLERRTAISVFGNIHAMFFVRKADEFRKMLEACQQNKIEYTRCILWCPASLDDISSLVNNPNLKKVTLVYYIESDMLKGDELQKVQKIANDLDTELEVLKSGRDMDAWKQVDVDFYVREYRRRWNMRNR